MKPMTRAKYDSCIRNVEANLLRTLEPLPEPQFDPMPQPRLERKGKTWTLTLAQVAKVQQLKRVDSFQQGTARSYVVTGRPVRFPKVRTHSQRVTKPKATDHRLGIMDKGEVELICAVAIAQQEAEAKNAMAEALQNWLEE